MKENIFDAGRYFIDGIKSLTAEKGVIEIRRVLCVSPVLMFSAVRLILPISKQYPNF
jgi:hypothetical protein